MHKAGPLTLLMLLVGCGSSPDAVVPTACVAEAGAVSSEEVESGPYAEAGDVANEAVSEGAAPEAEAQVDAPFDAAPADPDAARSCDDKLKNGDETDVDCGGSCPACGPNKACIANSDCSATASGCDANAGGCTCDALSKKCVYNHCYDHKRDIDETAIDCGGDVCPGCALDQGCQVNGDCISAGCDAVSLTCALEPCIDHQQDGTESDVDCGGTPGVCARCQVGRKCRLNADCVAGHTCSTNDPRTCI